MNRLLLLLAVLGTCSVNANKKNFCKPLVDYTPRFDKEENRTICATVIKKVVEEVTEMGCLDVVSMECDVVVVPDCTTTTTEEMSMMDIPVIANATLLKCEKTTVMKDHVKEVYECHNVTKTHCTTLWKLVNGVKVWAGNEDDCREVTWEECNPVNKTVPFPEPDMKCENITVPYNDVGVMFGSVNLTSTDCKSSPQQVCTPTTAQKCGVVTFTRITEVPEKVCKVITIMVPTQDKIHKEWCLFNQADNIDFDAEVKIIKAAENEAAEVPLFNPLNVINNEPVVAEPVVAELVEAEPVIAEPVVAEPVVAEPEDVIVTRA